MSARDLLQRRSTNQSGDTVWIDSPIVQAAKTVIFILGNSLDNPNGANELIFLSVYLGLVVGVGRNSSFGARHFVNSSATDSRARVEFAGRQLFDAQ
jgi:hypothetical protein